MPIGAQVTCRVMLDGRPASLPGRVAWRNDAATHQEARSLHGMGICFEPLGTYERGLLKHLLERSVAGYRAVELLFPGLDEPVVARARTRANGLRLSAALPIFARDTEVSFQLDAEGPVLTGRIGQAVLHEDTDGTRRIDVEVDVVEAEETGRYRRRARYGYAPELEAEPLAPAGDTAPAPRDGASVATAKAPRELAPTEPGLRVAVQSVPRSGPRWQVLAAGVAGAGLAWWSATALQKTSANEDGDATVFVAHPRAPERAAMSDGLPAIRAAPLPPAENTAPTPVPAVAGVALPEHAVRTADTASLTARTRTEPPNPSPTATASVQKPARHEAPAVAELGVDPAQVLESEAAPEPAPAALDIKELEKQSEGATAKPEAVLENGATRLRLPFSGDLEGMRCVVWSDPVALAIDLPHGSSAVAEGSYPIGIGGITELRVNKRGDVLLIRVKLSSPIGRYAITAENGTLEARLVQAPTLAR
jgi:hypothetical protein